MLTCLEENRSLEVDVRLVMEFGRKTWYVTLAPQKLLYASLVLDKRDFQPEGT